MLVLLLAATACTSCKKTQNATVEPAKSPKTIATTSTLPAKPYSGPTSLPCARDNTGTTSKLTSVTTQTLHGVFNASGLGVTNQNNTSIITTANDYDRWHKAPPAPQLFVDSNPKNGVAVGGRFQVGQYPSVEGIAAAGGRFAFLFSPKEGEFAIVEGSRTTPLESKISQVILNSENRVPKPRQIFVEGLAFSEDGYEVLATVKHDTGASDDDPQTAMSVRRVRITSQGRLIQMSQPLHWPDNRPYNDYGGALDVLANQLAIVPGFYNNNVHLVAPSGQIVRTIIAPSIRVEGVQWDPQHCRMYLVRECVGVGYECDELEPKGVPMWILSTSR